MELGPLGPANSWTGRAATSARFGSYRPRESEFVRPVQIMNMITGQWMPFDGEIHEADVEWLVALLNEGWALDWKLQQAEEVRHALDSPAAA